MSERLNSTGPPPAQRQNISQNYHQTTHIHNKNLQRTKTALCKRSKRSYLASACCGRLSLVSFAAPRPPVPVTLLLPVPTSAPTSIPPSVTQSSRSPSVICHDPWYVYHGRIKCRFSVFVSPDDQNNHIIMLSTSLFSVTVKWSACCLQERRRSTAYVP